MEKVQELAKMIELGQCAGGLNGASDKIVKGEHGLL